MKKIIIILLVLLIGGATIFFMFNRPSEKENFLKAIEEATCLVAQSKGSDRSVLEQKTNDIFNKYGFDVEDSKERETLTKKYDGDEDITTAMNEAIKKCASKDDVEALTNAPAKARDTMRISNLQRIKMTLFSANIGDEKPYPIKSGPITEDLAYDGYGGTNTWAELKDEFGETFPSDPIAGKNYYYISKPEGFEFGVFAFVEIAQNANAVCTAGDKLTITLGEPSGTFDPKTWCYAILAK